MENVIIKVEGMVCEHCSNAVTGAVGGLEGVAQAKVDLKAKTVAVEYDSTKVSLSAIREEIEGQGFEVVE